MHNHRPAPLYLGTSSWSFVDWKEVFYPSTLVNNQRLGYYAQRFNTVEVNTSFYGLPSSQTLMQWLDEVPPGFRFALKCPRAITHEKKLAQCEAETHAYLETLRALGKAAAPSLIQLPPHLSRQQRGRVLADYLTRVAANAPDVRLSVEVRAPDLMTEAFARFVAEQGMSLVLVDRTRTPDLFDPWLALIEAQIAPSFVYIRWMGDDRNPPPDNRQLRTPRDADLDRWAVRIEKLLDAGVEVYGYMHNPYEGHSPASVERLSTRLAARGVALEWAPEPVLAAKSNEAEVQPDAQPSLFNSDVLDS